MKIKTLDLMMVAASLPVNDHIELFLMGQQFDVDEKSTQLNIFNDMFDGNKLYELFLPNTSNTLIDALNDFANIVHPRYQEFSRSYSQSKDCALSIIHANKLPEMVEVTGRYSLRFAVVLVSGTDLPGYSYQQVADFYQQGNPNLSQDELANAFISSYPEKLGKLITEFKEWWSKYKGNSGRMDVVATFKAQNAINDKFVELQKKYDVPYYLKV